MEADFNAPNKILYGVRMMQNAREHHLMPEEIYNKKNRMADNRTLTKTLFYDVTCQARVPAAIASIDATAMIGLHTLWHHWSPRLSESQSRESSQC